MKILVTGGGGFLGAWVLRRLSDAGHSVRVLDASADHSLVQRICNSHVGQLDWQVGDVSRTEDLVGAAAGCDVIVHLAGLLTPACQLDPIRGAEINLIGTINAFEAAKAHGVSKVVYTSSVSVFGLEDGEHPRPATHYGAFKLACEGCARTYWAYDRIASVGLRPSVVYGPGRETGLTGGLTLACKAAADGRDYEIPFSGETDVVFVDDVAATVEAAALTQTTGAYVFNVLGERVDVSDFASVVEGHGPGISIQVKGGTVPFTATFSADALREVFPELPRTPVDAGVARTVDFYRRQRGLQDEQVLH